MRAADGSGELPVPSAAAHHEQLRGDERIGYHALYGQDGEIPGQLSIDDLQPSVDADHDGEVSA